MANRILGTMGLLKNALGIHWAGIYEVYPGEGGVALQTAPLNV
jgi:hypothetical protein